MQCPSCGRTIYARIPVCPGCRHDLQSIWAKQARRHPSATAEPAGRQRLREALQLAQEGEEVREQASGRSQLDVLEILYRHHQPALAMTDEAFRQAQENGTRTACIDLAMQLQERIANS